MVWVRMTDNFDKDARIKALAQAGHYKTICFWLSSIAYCNRELTDGVVDAETIATVAARLFIRDPKPVVAELVELGLWRVATPGQCWYINAYADYQPTKGKTERGRAVNRRRVALWRQGDGEVVKAIQTRDADQCRYCGQSVVWHDKRSPLGATYDHVDPEGPNSFLNVVVACRGCNSAKGNRTPEQAGMPLRPPPNDIPPPVIDYGLDYSLPASGAGRGNEKRPLVFPAQRNGKTPMNLVRKAIRHV